MGSWRRVRTMQDMEAALCRGWGGSRRPGQKTQELMGIWGLRLLFRVIWKATEF